MTTQYHSDVYAVIKAAQYLSGLTTQQNIWSEAGTMLIRFLDADVAAFGERGVDRSIAQYHWHFSDNEFGEYIRGSLHRYDEISTDKGPGKDIEKTMIEVAESGFVAQHVIGGEHPLSLAFFPVSRESSIVGVMMVGYRTSQAFKEDRLNLYLALAGLIGSTGARLALEKELKEHRRHLEAEVKQRTAELESINVALQSEIDERRKTEEELTVKNEKLTEAFEQIKTLRGIIPICSSCKKIRNDDGYYEQVEAYITKNSDVEFSHSICPECMKKLYPRYTRKEKGKDS